MTVFGVHPGEGIQGTFRWKVNYAQKQFTSDFNVSACWTFQNFKGLALFWGGKVSLGPNLSKLEEMLMLMESIETNIILKSKIQHFVMQERPKLRKQLAIAKTTRMWPPYALILWKNSSWNKRWGAEADLHWGRGLKLEVLWGSLCNQQWGLGTHCSHLQWGYSTTAPFFLGTQGAFGIRAPEA